MKEIAIDVWHDLREKKLAPVAILLLIALIAVPTLLAKSPAAVPVPAPPAGPMGAGTAPGEGAPQLKPVAQLEDSKLDTYSPKNPFAPLPALKAPSELPVVSADPAGGSGGDTPALAGGGSDSSTPSFDGGGGGGVPALPSPGPIRGPGPDAETTLYTYVVDLDFGPPGRERARKGLARLEVLPNAEQPLLVFLGVSADSKQAVFLADSTASQSGEGRCKPNADTCTFIHLSTAENRNEHSVTDSEGQEYLLRLNDIRRVEVDELKQREARRRKAERQKAKSSESSTDTTGSAGLKRLFGFVLFADEEQ